MTSISGKVKRIGNNAYVGAGALLTSDIIDNTNIFLINTKLLNLKYEEKEKTL